MAKPPNSPNHLLASLNSADFEFLRPHLKSIELKHEVVLFEAGDKVEEVYFPHSGIISLVVDLTGGQTIEAAMIGCDSIVGASSALDGRGSLLNKGIVQLPGAASTVAVGPFRKAAKKASLFARP